MFRQRVLLYFTFVAALLIAATVVGQALLVQRVLEHSRQADLRLAVGVAGHVAESLEDPHRDLLDLLAELPPDLDPAAVRRALALSRDALLEPGGVSVFGPRVWGLGAESSRAGLPPPHVLLPALRAARQSNALAVTPQWRGADGHPRVSLVAFRPLGGDDWRAAVGTIRLDDEQFLNHFGFVVNDAAARLQLLDGSGVALYSTVTSERYRSAVHGTYLLDSMYQGQPRQLACHSCHENPAGGPPVREDEVATVAPVRGTSWTVLVRENSSAYDAAFNEMVANLVVLVSLIVGALGGFFWLLNRRVLKPMRQLARAATVISAAAPNGRAPSPESDDEEAELERTAEVALATPGDVAAPGDAAPPPARDTLDLPEVRVSSPEDLHAALRAALVPAVSGFQKVEIVSMLLVSVHGNALGEPLVAGTAGSDVAALAAGLRKVEPGPKMFTVKELQGRGVDVGALRGISALRRAELHLSGGLRGEVWIGGRDPEAVAHLKSIGVLIALHLQAVLERALLSYRLWDEFQQKGRILEHLVEAENEERKRIARDIHDDTSQSLAALALLLEAFPQSGPPELQAASLRTLHERVQSLIDSTDRIMKRLRPALLDDLGLVDAVRKLGEDLLGEEGVGFQFHAPTEEIQASPELEDAVYRVFVEALQNVVRHADATKVVARLEVRGDLILASVEDDGQGMPPQKDAAPRDRPRFGLLGMRERIALLGGQFRLSSSAMGGVRVEFSVPFRARAAPRPAPGPQEAAP